VHWIEAGRGLGGEHTADVPSRIAFATSLGLARVGWRADHQSSICVAVIWLPDSRQRRMIRFPQQRPVAAPISTPRSPRATITAPLPKHVVAPDRLGLLDRITRAGEPC
jgi:hypothetical protein